MIAAAVLGEPGRGEEAARLLTSGLGLAAPSHWKAELANVLWKAVRLGRVAAEDVDEILGVAEALPIASVDVAEIWRGALARAIASGHPAYDALFVELAERRGARLVTYDRLLAKRFPAVATTPDEVLSR